MLTRRKLLNLATRGLALAGQVGTLAAGVDNSVASAKAGGQTSPATSKAPSPATEPAEFPRRRPPRFHDGRDWFIQKRFGLFAHWGIFAVGESDNEEMYHRAMTREEYAPYMQKFNPTRFNPDAWLDLAEEAGMEYLTVNAKHIDGFCMWNTRETRFNVMNTPFGKDTMKMIADACHRRKFPLCLYYSIVDEYSPLYPNAGRAYEFPAPQPGDEPDEEKFLASVRRQVQELCTNYGELGGFWWDVNMLGRKDPSFNNLIRSLQPNAVINNRGFDEGDFSTPERDWDDSVNTQLSFQKRIEACQAVGYQAWSYRANEDYYSTAHLIRSIQKIMAKGGNYLLDVGPKPDGTMPEEAATILRRIGKWYKTVKESLVDVDAAGMMTTNRNVLLTQRGHTLYVHVFKEQEISAIYLPPIAALPRRATLLNTGEKAECEILATPRLARQKPNHCLRLKNLPVDEPASVGLVVKLEFQGGMDADATKAA